MMNGRQTLLIGACERDNFGDMLFMLVTSQQLSTHSITAGGLVAADTRALTGFEVHPYVEELQRREFDCVWVVGGAVGGTLLDHAMWMVGADGTQRRTADRDHPSTGASEQTVLSATASPYLPRLDRLCTGRPPFSVINSVGLAGIYDLPGPQKLEAISAVRAAHFVSVRDRRSSFYLSRLGIRHTLAPDVVHLLAATRPRPPGTRSDVALVQVNETTLSHYGTDAFARCLANSVALRAFDLRLFVAGTAPGHDSLDQYRGLVAAFERLSSRRLTISTASTPLDKVDEIAGAALWMGTSLHGLIVASAYEVPRVGLSLDKVRTYARTWGDHMPVGVEPHDIDAAVSFAVGGEAKRTDLGRGRRLAALAAENVRQAVARLDTEGTGYRADRIPAHARATQRVSELAWRWNHKRTRPS